MVHYSVYVHLMSDIGHYGMAKCKVKMCYGKKDNSVCGLIAMGMYIHDLVSVLWCVFGRPCT